MLFSLKLDPIIYTFISSFQYPPPGFPQKEILESNLPSLISCLIMISRNMQPNNLNDYKHLYLTAQQKPPTPPLGSMDHILKIISSCRGAMAALRTMRKLR